MAKESPRGSISAASRSTAKNHGLGKSRGRPSAKTFINVQVKSSTRDALNQLKIITGLKTQGEILDILIADVMKRRPR
jgi:hypothetical protein